MKGKSDTYDNPELKKACVGDYSRYEGKEIAGVLAREMGTPRMEKLSKFIKECIVHIPEVVSKSIRQLIGALEDARLLAVLAWFPLFQTK